jgi:hypothetical protein
MESWGTGKRLGKMILAAEIALRMEMRLGVPMNMSDILITTV